MSQTLDLPNGLVFRIRAVYINHHSALDFTMRCSVFVLIALSWCWCFIFSLAFSLSYKPLPRTTGGGLRCSLPPRYALSTRTAFDTTASESTSSKTGSALSPVELVKLYTQTAIEKAGSDEGAIAIEKLGQLCSQRNQYNFDEVKTADNLKGSVVSAQRQVLPPSTTTAFLRQVQLMEEKGWLSTNPDSVDGLPSLHLNLISQGKPLFDPKDTDMDAFQHGIQRLLAIVQPHIENHLLPNVQKLMNSTDVVVSDVFMRRYGEDIAGGATRHGISAHYDVYAKVTAVIALDNVAADGRNGLYTTATFAGETSNHASLRRFFPITSGDAVVHTWDVLHGVDVQPGLDRTSLIVWFSTKDAMVDSVLKDGQSKISPWLANHPCLSSNDVVQFVLASALESASTLVDGVDTSRVKSMYHEQPAEMNGIRHHDLYLESAARGNAFALTRLGSLCQDDALSSERIKQATEIAERLGTPPETLTPLLAGGKNFHQRLARRFWLESARKGNPLAQIALGDEAMELAVISGDDKMRVVAATMFALAAQQGFESANDALSRVVAYEASACQCEEEFLVSPVLRVAQATSFN